MLVAIVYYSERTQIEIGQEKRPWAESPREYRAVLFSQHLRMTVHHGSPSLSSARMLLSATQGPYCQKQPILGAQILTSRHRNLPQKQRVEFLVHLADCL